MNRQEVMKKLEPVLGMRVRDFDHGASGRVVLGNETVAIRPGRGRTYQVADGHVLDLFQFTGVPQTLAKSLQTNTMERVLTECLRNKGRYGLVLQDDQVVGITPYRERHPVDPERVLTTMERAIPEADFQRVLTLPNHVVSIDAVGVDERPVRAGDLVRAGTEVIFSPIGTELPTVQSYILRLTCTNGATATDAMRTFGYGEGDNMWQWFRQSVQRAYNAIGGIVTAWQNMIEEGIDPRDRAMVIEQLIKQARLGKLEADSVRSRAIEAPPENAYDAMNLLTWATSHVVEDPVRVMRGRQVAAEYASAATHRRVCPTCSRER